MAPRGTLLVVDDDEGVREVTEAILRDAGFDVVSVSDAVGALQVLESSTPLIDLVVTDVLLEGMDGFALAVILRKTRPKLPIIFLSGYSGAATLDGALGPMLNKPVHAAELADAVSRVLGEVRGRNDRR